MRILILGSAGQIGFHLNDYLCSLGHKVTGFDIVYSPEQDLRIPGVIDHLLRDTDFVFFLAYDVGGAAYLKKYQETNEFISNNIRIMDNTFRSLKTSNVPFIFTSSSMYNMTFSSYGSLKNIGEKYCQELNGKVVRFWNVYGREPNQLRYHVITDLIKKAQQGSIHLETTGEEVRQFLYVDDACKAMNWMMNSFHREKQKTYDVSSFEWITIKKLAKIIAKEFNVTLTTSKAKDTVQRYVSESPTTDILGFWFPETKLKDGIKKMINFYS